MATVSLPKGILRKEGVTYAKKSLQFKENIIEDDPVQLSEPKFFSENIANDLEQENFRQVWREVSNKKLEYAARKLQKFAREHMLCWIITNDRRTEMYEELDYIQERLQNDLRFVEWEKDDMRQEAELEIQAERENAPPEEYNQVKEDLATIKGLQAEIRTLKAENQKLKLDAKGLKKENKQLGYDLKEKAPAVEMSKHKAANLEENHKKIQRNHDQFPPNIKKWQESVDQITQQLDKCREQGHAYRDTCLEILRQVKLRYPRKRVLKPIKEILEQEFVNYHPIPSSDDENNNAKPSALQRSSTTGTDRVGRIPKEDKPDGAKRASSTGMYKSKSKSPTPTTNNKERKERQKIRKSKTDSEVGLVNKLKENNSHLLHKVAEEVPDEAAEKEEINNNRAQGDKTEPVEEAKEEKADDVPPAETNVSSPNETDKAGEGETAEVTANDTEEVESAQGKTEKVKPVEDAETINEKEAEKAEPVEDKAEVEGKAEGQAEPVESAEVEGKEAAPAEEPAVTDVSPDDATPKEAATSEGTAEDVETKKAGEDAKKEEPVPPEGTPKDQPQQTENGEDVKKEKEDSKTDTESEEPVLEDEVEAET